MKTADEYAELFESYRNGVESNIGRGAGELYAQMAQGAALMTLAAVLKEGPEDQLALIDPQSRPPAPATYGGSAGPQTTAGIPEGPRHVEVGGGPVTAYPGGYGRPSGWGEAD